ncbi:MAG: DUF2071 domain-containing protein [Verrucomicrobiota bacterium]
MKIPMLHGLIRRRLLVNFRVDPRVIAGQLPAPFRPKLQAGHAIAGLCLIRLEHVRPAGWPANLGMASENAAHRVAVAWTDPGGATREGVFIFRRDTSSGLAHLAGGRLFPGVHHRAAFRVHDDGRRVDLAMASADGAAWLRVRGEEAETLPATSCFASLADASLFFERGCVGYSPGGKRGALDGLRLETPAWRVRPFALREVESRWLDALAAPLPGSAQLDHALIMRDMPHAWHAVDERPGEERR